MLRLFALVILFQCATVTADTFKEGTTITPVRPNGERDWKSNSYRVEGGQVVQIRPDGQRDWSANTYRAEGNQIVPVSPNGERDWHANTLKR